MLQKNLDILATSLSILRNYFDSSTKLLSDLYPAKILDLSAILSVQATLERNKVD